jgi:muramoyltetrapeptide carboxypeptidase LdcA involved in peptidoglycan recycling
LIKAGADPNSAFYSALYADDINVLKNLLTYNVTIPIDIIATALSYRYYDKLLLLVNHQTSPLPDNVKNQINNLIYNKQYKQVEAILLPYFTDLGAYYENRDKNYYKAGGEDRTLSYFSIAERENMNFF